MSEVPTLGVEEEFLLVDPGSGAPVAIHTMTRNNSPKGAPKKKRTCVAPAVPMLAVSWRCAALRKVCAAAAISVKTIQR